MNLKNLQIPRITILGFMMLLQICGCSGGSIIENLKISGFEPDSAPPARVVKAICQDISQDTKNIFIQFPDFTMPAVNVGDGFVQFITPALPAGDYQVNLKIDNVTGTQTTFTIKPNPPQKYTQDEFSQVVSDGINELINLESILVDQTQNVLELHSPEQLNKIKSALALFTTISDGLKTEIQEMEPEQAEMLQALLNETGVLNVLSELRNGSFAQRTMTDFDSTFHPELLALFYLDQLSMLTTNIGALLDFGFIAAVIVTKGAALAATDKIMLAKIALYGCDYIMDTFFPTDFTDVFPYSHYPIRIEPASWTLEIEQPTDISFVGHFRCQDKYFDASVGTIIDVFMAAITMETEIPKEEFDALKYTVTTFFEKIGIDVTKMIIGNNEEDYYIFEDVPIEMDMSIYDYTLFDALQCMFLVPAITPLLNSIFDKTGFYPVIFPSVIINDHSIISYDSTNEKLIGYKEGNTIIQANAYCMSPIKVLLWNFEFQTWKSSIEGSVIYVTGDNNPPVWDGPVGIQSVTPGDKSITVTFGTATDPDGDYPVTYNLYYCDETATGDNNPFVPPYEPPVSNIITSPYTLHGLINGHKYWLGVRAKDSKGLEEQNLIKLSAMPGGDIQVDTPDMAWGVYVTGGYAYVADRYSGLQIIDVEPPESASIVKSVDTPGWACGVYVTSGYAYVADEGSGLQIIDVDPIGSASIVKSVDTSGEALGVYVTGSYAYVADGGSGLQIIDIETIGSERIVKSVDTPGEAEEVYVTGGYAYVADDWSGGLQIIDVEPIGSASIVKTVDIPGWAYGVYVTSGYAYVADYMVGLQIIDVDPPESASIVKSVDTPGYAEGVYVTGGYAYVADEYSGLQIIDVDPPESASIVKSIDTLSSAYGVYVTGGYAYVAVWDGGLRIIKLW